MRTAIIVSGQTYGRLTAIADAGKTPSGHPLWKFRCSCGETVLARTYRIRDGRTQSCGCLHTERIRNANRRRTGINVGDKFGCLTAISEHAVRNRQILWLWACDCGSKPIINGQKVKCGHTKSCGCLSRESARARLTTHGQSGDRSKEYRAWTGLRARCNNPRSSSYPDYGARGITVCKRWDSFANFLADVGPAPSPAHSIDRTDNSRGYEPGNCTWQTRVAQMNNRRGNVTLTHEGKTMSLTAWAKLVGLKRATLAARIRMGWTVHRSLTAPLTARIQNNKG